jgi:DNA invertase Pin-like site-specific DNA recombinase
MDKTDMITTTTTALAKLFETAIAKKDRSEEPIKYIIYTRKSTDEEGKQVRSIEDQVAECKAFARSNNIDYYDIIEEKFSAKESNKRPKFRKMLEDIEKGKYGGILSWHPDRLSRNMKEAGEIIDMLDKDVIRDLKFVSFTFNNDPSGKLLLGITFAMSKEYSDKLSVNVMRGNKHKLLIGNYVGKAKNGYYKDQDGKMRPDGENFKLLQQAFKMRLGNNSLQDVANFINKGIANAATNSPSGKTLPTFRKQDVGELVKEPAYTGVIVHGNQVIDFNDIYDFVPMVTPDEFLELNKNSKTGGIGRVVKYIRKNGVRANLLRGCVLCSSCNHPMTTSITVKYTRNKSKHKNYFYFRCDTKGCSKKNVSTRAKVVLDYASQYIADSFTYNKDTWLHYKKEMQRLHKQALVDLSKESASLYTLRKNLLEKMERTKEKLLLMDSNSRLVKDFEQDYEESKEQLEVMERKLGI